MSTDQHGITQLTGVIRTETRYGSVEAIGEIQTSDPDDGSPVDDRWWIMRDGASPETIALRVRIDGVTYNLAELPAPSAPVGLPTIAITAGQSFVSNTFTNLTGFAQAVAAHEVWIVEGWFFLTNAAATGDFKYTFTGPVGASFIAGGHRLNTNTTANTDQLASSYNTPGSPSAGIAAGGLTSISIVCTLTNGANAGTFQVQGAQNTTDAGNATTLTAGSWVRFTRVS